MKTIRYAFAMVAGLVAFAAAAYAPYDFKKELPIEVSASGPADAVTDARVLVRLSSDIEGFSYSDIAADGSDIVFGTSDGVTITEYPHEIGVWNADGVSTVWVKVPSLASGTKFSMWYGNGVEVPSSAASVWSGYTGVWHMDEASGNCADSTGNGLAAVPTGAKSSDSVGVDGAPTGVGRQFGTAKGNKTYLLVANNDLLDVGNTFTLSGWFKASSCYVGYSMRYFSRKKGYTEGSGFEAEARYSSSAAVSATTVSTRGASKGDFVQTIPDVTADWVNIVWCFKGTSLTYYVNGVEGSTVAMTTEAKDNNYALAFGNNPSGSESNWTGWMDEIRLCTGTTSAGQLAVDYATVHDASFLSYSAVKDTDISMPLLDGMSASVAAGSVTITANFSQNLPAADSVSVEINGTEYPMTTAATAVPAAYTATIDGLAADLTYDFSIHFSSVGGSAVVTASPNPFYLGDISVAKVCDAEEATLTPGRFRVSRADTGSALTVNYSVGGTATPDADYEELSGSVVIPAGASTGEIVVTPIFNVKQEADVTVEVTLTSGCYRIAESAKTASLTIVNAVVDPSVQYVSTDGDDDNDGLSAFTAKATIAAAVTNFDFSAIGSGTVKVLKGQYAEKLVPGGSCVTLEQPVSVVGATGNATDVVVTTVLGGKYGRIFKLNHSDAKLKHLTIRGGSLADGSNVYIGTNGGTAEDCIVNGGGNNAWNAYGSGFYAAAGRVTRCQVVGLTVAAAWGVMYGKGSAVFDNCLVARNTTGSGYSIVLDGNAVAANCTVAGNTGSSGSGIKVNSKTATAVNCAIFGNTASSSTTGSVWSNANPSRFIGCGADLAIAGSVDCVVGEALFRDAANCDYRITAASCCLDAGVDPSAYASYSVDLAGNPRVVDVIDIGCYEQQKTALDCSFTCSLPNQVLPATATFAAKVIGATGTITGTWDFGDGASAAFDASTMAATHEYTVSGTYTVKLTITDGTGNASYERKSLVQVAPATMYVRNGNQNAEFPYATEASAAAKLADAVAAAVDGVTIFVLPGENAVITQNTCVTLEKGVRVLGSTGSPDDIVFENQYKDVDGHRLFLLNHPQAFLGNVTVKDGSLRANNSFGADIYINSAGGTVSNCVINSGRAQHFSSYGAGLSMTAGLVTHTRITGEFRSCPAYNADPTGCGVAVRITGGSMENCLFDDISLVAGSDGTSCGPIVSISGGTMFNCTINGNCQCVPTTSTDPNFSKYNGGSGIYCSSTKAIVKNCVVVNVTNATGTALVPFSGDVRAFNNCAGDGAEVWGGTSCVGGTVDELFRDAANKDYRPLAPLINAGTPVELHSSVDYAGKPRLASKAIDIGAFESIPKGLGIFLR